MAHSEQGKPMEDPVSISIDEMLKNISLKSAKPCISKVPNYLRQVNEKAYEPQVISIGPYHHGENHLGPMQEQKIRFLQKLLEERKENDVSVYVSKMRELEDKARKCYAEPLSDLCSDDFVKMLLLDGVFIVQMIRMYLEECPEYLKDMLGCYSCGLYLALRQDMLLVENQLPLFVVWELFCMVKSKAVKHIFMQAIFEMLRQAVPGKVLSRNELNSWTLDIKHLLEFTYHWCYHPSTSEMNYNREKNQDVEWKFIRCATELQEAGIKFVLVEGNSIFDISFENGNLYIPKIEMGDYTEPFLRNVIAFEQLFLADKDFRHATDYMIFMDNLIDSPKDVEILCQTGIIDNFLGDDKAVATMINSLGLFVDYGRSFYYTEVFNKINRHCSRRWNRWMANLKHNYFNSPWSLISVLAAVLLLLLTVLQTLFSILSYAQ
ncbi:hypothetical protein DITRI_Ditri15bG0062700 [Diplodiscus trichospermus]